MIDERIIGLRFENSGFLQKISSTLQGLDKLNAGLELKNGTQGIENAQAVADGFSLGRMGQAIDTIAAKFGILGSIGFSVIQRLVNELIDMGGRLAGKVIDPILTGGKKRAENIEQAKFQFRGLGMDIEATMASALDAVTGTSFGLDEAAKAAGMFGASGMEAGDDMTTALRAISGVAAMTNSSYTDTADIFTKVAGNGRVMGDDLLRMSSRGLNAAATLADAMGVSEEAVREMVTNGEVDFETFYRAMDNAFGENATKANETYSGSLANVKAAMSRMGAKFYTKNLEQQRDIFNALSPAIDGVTKALTPFFDMLDRRGAQTSQAIVGLLNGLDFTGLTKIVPKVVKLFETAMAALATVLAPLKDAFLQIFPPATTEDILGIVVVLQRFAESLALNADQARKFQSVFAGIFAVFGIAIEIVKAVLGIFGRLAGVLFEGSGGVLNFSAGLGDFLVSVLDAMREGEGFANFIQKVGDYLLIAVGYLQAFATWVKEAFGKLNIVFPIDLGELLQKLEPLKTLGEKVIAIFQAMGDAFSAAWDYLRPLTNALTDFMGRASETLAEAFSDIDWDKALDAVNKGLFAVLLLSLNNFIGGSSGKIELRNHLVDRMKYALTELSTSLQVMQMAVKARTIMQIAIAVGVLAASIYILSGIDGASLARATGAITAMFVQLLGSMYILELISVGKGFLRLPFVAGSLILMATAVLILAAAVRSLSGLGWEELAKGLAGVLGLVTIISAAAGPLSKNSKGLFTAGLGLIGLAIAIKILASAVQDFSSLSWEDMAKGLIGVGASLAALMIFTRMANLNKVGLASGAGLILMAAALKILASVVKDFSEMEWAELGKGLAGMGASLFIIAGAMKLMQGSLAGAVALIFVAGSLVIIGKVIESFAGMSWEEIAKGLVTLAGSLVIIAIAMKLMTTALPGAAALLVVAFALGMLAPVIVMLGNMKWTEAALGLGILAGALIILGVAAAVMTPIIPGLFLIGGAIALIGLGVLAAGAGVLFLAMALTALAASGLAGAIAIAAFAASLFSLIPAFFKALGAGVVELFIFLGESKVKLLEVALDIFLGILDTIGKALPAIWELISSLITGMLTIIRDKVPEFIETATVIIMALLEAVQKLGPEIIETLGVLISALVEEITTRVPEFAEAALEMIVAILDVIADNIDDVIESGTDVVVAFIEGIGDAIPRLVEAGADLIVDFVNALAQGVRNNSAEMREAGGNLASAIISGMTLGLSDGAGKVLRAARGVALGAFQAAKDALKSRSPSKRFRELGRDSDEGLRLGLLDGAKAVEKTSVKVARGSLEAMRRTMREARNVVADDMNTNPTITPVLDLSQIRKRGREIDDMFSPQVNPRSAYLFAGDITRRERNRAEADLKRNDEVAMLAAEARRGRQVVFEQNNYSPKALTPAEIYRQTKTLIPRVREGRP